MGRRPRRRGEGSALSSPGSRRRGGPAGLAPVATPVGGTGSRGDPGAVVGGLGRSGGRGPGRGWGLAPFSFISDLPFIFLFSFNILHLHLSHKNDFAKKCGGGQNKY